MKNDYTYTQNENPHIGRGREILKKYPEVRKYIGNYPLSGLYITLLVLFQFSLGYLLNDQPIWVPIVLAYILGAIISHSLFVMIHEACHNLIFKKTWTNNLMGILCNIGQGFPSYFGFKTFHLMHHTNLNEYDYDADLAFHWEAKLINNKSWRKVFWLIGFCFVEAIRPAKLKNSKVIDGASIFNIILIIATNILVYQFLGANAFLYIFFSTFFGVGLHPVGGRWIQEHYTFKEGQETYSYYGLGNKVAFNIGYHNEHHDIMTIPWVYLPKLKKLAPEYYNHLMAHQSWTKVLITFLFNKKFDLYSRIVRNKPSEGL